MFNPLFIQKVWTKEEDDYIIGPWDSAEKVEGLMRQFDTGATRDTDEGKFDYEAFLSPVVLERYAAYMHKNRIQSDGSMRAGDNWQNLFGKDHYDVCIKSGVRHFIAWWKFHRGVETESPWFDRTNGEDALCAVIFNASAYLFALLEEKDE